MEFVLNNTLNVVMWNLSRQTLNINKYLLNIFLSDIQLIIF